MGSTRHRGEPPSDPDRGSSARRGPIYCSQYGVDYVDNAPRGSRSVDDPDWGLEGEACFPVGRVVWEAGLRIAAPPLGRACLSRLIQDVEFSLDVKGGVAGGSSAEDQSVGTPGVVRNAQ